MIPSPTSLVRRTRLLLAGLLAGLLALPFHSYASIVLSGGHLDIAVEGHHDELEFHVHDEATDIEYDPSDVLLQIGAASQTLSPGGAFAPYLGPAGTPAWVLPGSPSGELLFLGWSTDELDPADWLGPITFTLKAVDGPGDFSLWRFDAFAHPEFLMSTVNGIDESDAFSLPAGVHAHFNLGFTAPGDYRIEFEASGLHAEDGLVASDPTSFHFQVVPEPSTWALFGLGMAGLLWHLRRNRSRRTPTA